MRKKIELRIRQFHMLEPGDRVLIGLSGGADSLCLAEILCQLREELKLRLGAVYCHHGIRGQEADEDGAFVKQYCDERNISYYSVYEKVEERAKSKKISVEEAGREFRYENFGKIMEEGDYHVLALAHHANDRAETMLFHLARGTNLSGLCTMEPIRNWGNGKKIIRPLLWTERKEIESWLSNQHLSWRTDSTNQSNIYTRNRIRHQILPELQEVNRQAVSHMGEAADAIGEAVDYLQIEQKKLMDSCVEWASSGKSARIHLSELKEAHIYMKKGILYQVLAQIAGTKKDISKLHVKSLLDLMEGQSGREINLGKNVYGRKEYDDLILSMKDFGERKREEEEKSLFLSNIEMIMEIHPYTGQEISKNKYTKYFDCDKIKDNLVLRYWQEGDYLYLREDGGKKKLNRYFIDEKIPLEERKQIPLLAEGSHILWVVGYRISAYYKVTEQTKHIAIIHLENKG